MSALKLHNIKHNRQLLKMKLSILFVAATNGKKLLEPVDQLTKIRGHIDFVWKQWYGGCNENRSAKKGRYHAFVDKIELEYLEGGCGYFNKDVENGGPAPSRKRREDDEELALTGNTAQEQTEFLSKTNKDKAVKQIGMIITRFAEAHLAECTSPFAGKIAGRAAKWIEKMQRLKCGGGPGQ